MPPLAPSSVLPPHASFGCRLLAKRHQRREITDHDAHSRAYRDDERDRDEKAPNPHRLIGPDLRLPIVVMDLLHTSTDPSRGAGVTTSLVPDKLLHPQRHRRRNGPAEALNPHSRDAKNITIANPWRAAALTAGRTATPPSASRSATSTASCLHGRY